MTAPEPAGASAPSGGPKLVMGASGYLGSHVVRQLVARGDDVRVWVRPASSTRAFDGLPVTRCAGELHDDDSIARAMQGVETVFYCIVDARPSLYDPAPLFRTNVDGLRHALDAAVATGVRRFIFCSTIGTIGHPGTGFATEDTPHEWAHLGGPYIQSRLQAERLVLAYQRERGLDAVVLCPSTTFGPDDFGPVAHGQLIKAVAAGRMPVYVRHQEMEVVGVEDAARAFLLAEAHGRSGERYIISDRMMTSRELLATAAVAVGRTPPRIGLPLTAMKVAGRLGDLVGRTFKRDVPLTSVSVRLMHFMPALDHSKATRELGWTPRPTVEAIQAHARFHAQQLTS